MRHVQYVAKLEYLVPACTLSVADELYLLQLHGHSEPLLAHRAAFLGAVLSNGSDDSQGA